MDVDGGVSSRCGCEKGRVTYPVVVDDLSDHGDFAGAGTGFDEDHCFVWDESVGYKLKSQNGDTYLVQPRRNA